MSLTALAFADDREQVQPAFAISHPDAMVAHGRLRLRYPGKPIELIRFTLPKAWLKKTPFL
ncbi:hypothetical protein [Nitrosomonas sp. Is37]|uniref:hypothetical protein n=1 Tax=Nitrosomonas sp. Is37 TaxID=3080535 RepID=UPI00294B6D82|nr:hypothetical protein [Nitrosomonas sp. Is37]MDV6343882.1 hypothetical protein [Nitrosomonas sp. Is37]